MSTVFGNDYSQPPGGSGRATSGALHCHSVRSCSAAACTDEDAGALNHARARGGCRSSGVACGSTPLVRTGHHGVQEIRQGPATRSARKASARRDEHFG